MSEFHLPIHTAARTIAGCAFLCFLAILLAGVTPPRAADFRLAFAEAAKWGEKRIVIPPGTYRLAPEGGNKVVWTVQGLQDVEIVADGVTLVATKLTRAVAFDRCSAVTIRGLTVDYDPLPFTQGRVVTAEPDAIEVKLDDGYPREPYSRIDVIDPATRFRKKGMPFLWGTKGEMRGDDVVRIALKGIGKTSAVGDLASLNTGPARDGIPHALSIERCSAMTLQNVTVHSAPGMGILECDGGGKTQYLGCRVVPGPRPAVATEERLLSTSWDALQTKTVRVGPRVEGCEVRDAGDDSWSVQSSDFLVLKRTGGTLVLASRDEFTVGVEAGDRLQTRLGEPVATIRSRRGLSRADAQLDAATLTQLEEAKPWGEWHVSPRCIEVTLDRDLQVNAGDSVYSPDRMGNGFAFLNNKIHSPGRILIKAAGRIEGNVLDTPHALTVCPEVPARAAAGVDGLIIRRNTIRRAGWFCPAPWASTAGALSITASGKPPELRPAGIFANLLIEENTFEDCSGPNVVITSARGVQMRGNRFIRPMHDRPPSTGASYQIPNNAVVWIAESDDVELVKNEIVDPGTFGGESIQMTRAVKSVRSDHSTSQK